MNIQQRKRLHRHTLIRTVVFYALVASLWIFLSDAILAWLIIDPQLLTRIQTIKGWLFVIVTATLLFFYLSHCLQALLVREEALEAEQAKAQQDILTRFQQLRTLFDSMNAIIYVADFSTHELLYVNRFTKELFGQNWQGRKCYHYLQEGIEQPCDFCTNSQLVKDGEPGPSVTWEFRNTINQHWYECFDKAIPWTNGELVRLEIALDVTERKELEKIKDDLLSTVSHEMRTPLTAISGFAELLLDNKGMPQEFQNHLQIIFNETEKMADLVNDFLEIRRLKTDRTRVDYTLLKVEDLFNLCLKNCRDRKEGHEIRFDGDTEAKVFGNHRELTQVISHLISNACRYSPAGGTIELKVKTKPNETQLCIMDHGVGIPAHELDNIFEPFHRLDTGDNRSTGGVGMGLSLVKEIVGLHGGRLRVESTPGEGSRFYITLPNLTGLSQPQGSDTKAQHWRL